MLMVWAGVPCRQPQWPCPRPRGGKPCHTVSSSQKTKADFFPEKEHVIKEKSRCNRDNIAYFFSRFLTIFHLLHCLSLDAEDSARPDTGVVVVRAGSSVLTSHATSASVASVWLSNSHHLRMHCLYASPHTRPSDRSGNELGEERSAGASKPRPGALPWQVRTRKQRTRWCCLEQKTFSLFSSSIVRLDSKRTKSPAFHFFKVFPRGHIDKVMCT